MKIKWNEAKLIDETKINEKEGKIKKFLVNEIKTKEKERKNGKFLIAALGHHGW